jgi:hypothetical protein
MLYVVERRPDAFTCEIVRRGAQACQGSGDRRRVRRGLLAASEGYVFFYLNMRLALHEADRQNLHGNLQALPAGCSMGCG